MLVWCRQLNHSLLDPNAGRARVNHMHKKMRRWWWWNLFTFFLARNLIFWKGRRRILALNFYYIAMTIYYGFCPFQIVMRKLVFSSPFFLLWTILIVFTLIRQKLKNKGENAISGAHLHDPSFSRLAVYGVTSNIRPCHYSLAWQSDVETLFESTVQDQEVLMDLHPSCCFADHPLDWPYGEPMQHNLMTRGKKLKTLKRLLGYILNDGFEKVYTLPGADPSYVMATRFIWEKYDTRRTRSRIIFIFA